MHQSKRLLIIAGGTAGHIFPGLVVAHRMIELGWQVRWLGTHDRIEADLVPKYDIEIDFIHISGLRGQNIKTLISSPIKILNAWHQARIIMKHFKPNVVLGMGGYVSGPGGLAAWSLGIPLIIHEQNSVAGLTNKWLAKIANKVIQAFPSAFPNAEVVGNPIRSEILSLPKFITRLQNRVGPIRVLVIGGSQGAQIFNYTMPLASVKLSNKVLIWHQSGKNFQHSVKQAYLNVGQLQHKVTEFIDDMASAYRWADIVICRSGALTVSEIAVVGIPAIFVPFQHKDRQQYLNALPLEKVGIAKILEQPQFIVDKIVAILVSWNRKKLLELIMTKSARNNLVTLNATERITQLIDLTAKHY